MLIRTIGNALPPRHDPAQALKNLRFILEHEKLEDEELSTHWVLNRLADEVVAQEFRKLLTQFTAKFTELPFELTEYAKIPFKVVVEDHGVDQVHAKPEGENLWLKHLNRNAIYDNKNRYALGINVARNIMLDIARASGAKWLMPWDQTCFLTREAWRQIKNDLDNASSDQKYFVSFMDRLKEDNDIIFSPNFKPVPWEEPQIIFRKDSIERFDEQLRYGQRDKAALLIRLQVHGAWDNWGWSSWERRRTYANLSKDVSGLGSVRSTGYVLRLYSGLASDAESNSSSAGFWREIRRAKGVIALLDKLEERVMREVYGYDPNRLLLYDEVLLTKYKNEARDNQLKQEILNLLDDANRALQLTKPSTITSSGNWHEVNQIAYDITALALSWRITFNKQYFTQAVSLLEDWRVNTPATMLPTLLDADTFNTTPQMLVTNDEKVAYYSFSHPAIIPMLLDAIRLLNTTNSNGLNHKITDWVQNFYNNLESAYTNDLIRWSSSVAALQYDIQVAALAAFRNNPKYLRYTLGTMQGRLLTMLSREEKLVVPKGVAMKRYTLLVLATWGFAIDFAQPFGLVPHLFHFDLTYNRREERVNKNGGLLCRLVGHTVPCCQSADTAEKLCAQNATNVEFFVYLNIVREAVEHCPILQKRPSCVLFARVQFDQNSVSPHEMSHYLLPPYPFLRAT
ncbi:hypothetical protein PsorP6_005900 [Peronosclerospora sorghi]|uniref:Uncharacterized protein n=1 Tax=Peronosclerospora sorghi TaxID=230839 RepID=A0ACC0W5D2_9STRA|nr:hypothetical protein PsorP6_005900 [Peronosclerospora sorghi]